MANYPTSPNYGGGGGGGYGPVQAMNPNGMGGDPLEEEQKTRAASLQVKELNVDEAKIAVQRALKTDIVPFLWGPPGVGKSSLVRAICEEENLKLIDLRLSLLNPVDLRGLPFIDKKNHTANWLPPTFLPKKEIPEKGILFLDEINLAPLSVQAAAYQLILDKRVGEYEFPPHWKIIAAGNRETDRANVYKISAPLANRFIHFTVIPDFKVWRAWGGEKIRPEIISYLVLRPALLYQMPSDTQKAFPSPRTWDFLSQLLDSYDYKNGEAIPTELQQTIVATIGEGTGKEFITFLADYNLRTIADQVETFVKTGRITMPKAVSARYAIITAIYDAYRSKTVDELKYRSFVKKLSGEEQKTMEVFEKKHEGEIDEKYKKSLVTDTTVSPMTMVKPNLASDKFIFVSTVAKLPSSGILMISDGFTHEIVEYDALGSPDAIRLIKRGLNGTKAKAWSQGAMVYKMKV